MFVGVAGMDWKVQRKVNQHCGRQNRYKVQPRRKANDNYKCPDWKRIGGRYYRRPDG